MYIFRLPTSTRKHPDFKKRYAWHIAQIFIVIVMTLAYSTFASVFVKIPPNYQWILAILSPLMKDAFTKVIGKVALRAAGKESTMKKSIQVLAQHYVSTI